MNLKIVLAAGGRAGTTEATGTGMRTSGTTTTIARRLPGPSEPAREMVQGPGTAMAVIGWVCLFLTAAGLLIVALVGAADSTMPRREFYFRAILFGVFGLIGIVMFAVIAVAGQSMRQCRRYGLCMTGAILLIASIVLLGLASVLTVPFGIWALVVLCDVGVKREFERPPPPRARVVDGEWEGHR